MVVSKHDNWLKVKDAHGEGGWIRADKTWGIEGEATKGLGKASTDKAAKADAEKSDHSDENAKSSHEDKTHGDKPAALPKAAGPPADAEVGCKIRRKWALKAAHARVTQENH